MGQLLTAAGSLLMAGSVLTASSSTFKPSIGLTRSQVEAIFHQIDGSKTTFRSAPPVDGTPRVLGSDRSLYTLTEILGYPEVTEVQVVTLLDAKTRALLEGQVAYDSLVCAAFGGPAAQSWCAGRVLHTDAAGLVTASASRTYGTARITVRTYQAARSEQPPVVSLRVGPA